MKIIFRHLVGLGLLAGLLAAPLFGSDGPDGGKKNKDALLNKTSQTKSAAILNINNFTSWQRADGQGQQPPNSAYNGGVYPRGTTNIIFADGMVWGGKNYLDAAHTQSAPVQVIRVGGSTYNVGNQIGWIQGTGAGATAVASSDPRARIYRIRRDYLSMSPDEQRKDAAENNMILAGQVTDANIADVQAQYEKDWSEWPVDLGAPYIERNGIAGYQKPPAFSSTFTLDSLISAKYDEPGVAGRDPNSPANQVIWSVFNDLNRGNMLGFEGSEPMGIEGQLTLWGYKRSDALGSLFFKRLKLINKGGAVVNATTGAKGSLYVDSMYVSVWSDPDLGYASDDLDGCDSVLSLAFTYNGNATDATYAMFNLPPPAIGYDFLAGPAVPGAATDTAVFDLKKKPGFKNLPMTSFCYFVGGGTIQDPPFTYEGALRWWRMFQGFVPDPSTSPFRKFPHPTGMAETFFPLSGDPVAGTGFLDGGPPAFSPGDRRLVLNTGPFRLSPLDTQEVVVGVVAGLGGDRLSSVSVLKANDRAVQKTYDLVFQVSQPPASPLPVATEMDGKVIIEWGSNASRVTDTETRVSQPGSYQFEGYNIYQLPTAGARLTEGKRIATYDVENSVGVILDQAFDASAGQILPTPIQFGTNSGVKRFFVLDRDFVRDINKVYNGQEYYLAVTAYSRATEAGFVAALESSPNVLTVRPRKPFGAVLNSSFGDTVKVTKTGPSDGQAIVQVVSPTQLTGHSYQVRFDSTGGTWRVIDVTANKTVLSGVTNQAGDAASPIINGMQVKVFGAPYDAKDFLHVAGPAGAINPPSYAAFSTFNDWGFPCGSGVDAASGGGPSIGDWGTGRWGIHTGGAGAGGDESYSGRFVPRVFRSSPYSGASNFDRFVPKDYEIRFTAAGGKAYLAFTTGAVINVPFEIWCTGVGTPNDPSDDYRMIPWINDADGDGAFNLQKADHALSGGDNDPYTDWIYWMEPNPKTPGSAGYNAFATSAPAAYDAAVSGAFPWPASTGTGDEVMSRVVLVNVNGGSVGDPTWPANVNSLMPPTGNVIRIVSTKPNSAADSYSFNTANYATTKTLEVEKTAVNRVNVFPNPYYAFNPAETNRFVRFVTFNNLPQKVKIRIYNLAGQLVRTLEKDDNSQFLRWDLNNMNHFPVASGLYIAQLELTLSDGTVNTKTLKVGIIQEQEVPDVF